jgi:uncharacterized protein YjiS (DUF1127 family)
MDMAAFDVNFAPIGSTSFGRRVKTAFSSLRDAIMHWRDKRTTINTLNRLSDHELEDIGINRVDIESLVNGKSRW